MKAEKSVIISLYALPLVLGLMFIGAAARAAQSPLDGDLENQRAQAGMRFERMALRAGAPEAVLAQGASAAPSVLKPSAAAGAPYLNRAPSKLAGANLALPAKNRGNHRSRPSPIWETLTDGPARGFYGILGMALLIVGITAFFSTPTGGISLLGAGVFFGVIVGFHLVADYVRGELPWQKKASHAMR